MARMWAKRWAARAQEGERWTQKVRETARGKPQEEEPEQPEAVPEGQTRESPLVLEEWE